MPALVPAVWPHIESLQAKTLHTVARSKAFTVETVTNAKAEITVHDGGKTRPIYRVDLEPFWRRLVENGELSIAELKTVYKFNSSLAAALLASMPGVTTSTNPITLRYGHQSSVRSGGCSGVK